MANTIHVYCQALTQPWPNPKWCSRKAVAMDPSNSIRSICADHLAEALQRVTTDEGGQG